MSVLCVIRAALIFAATGNPIAVRDRRGLVGCLRHAARHHRQRERDEHPPNFVVGQPGVAPDRDGFTADRTRVVDADIVESPEQGWRLSAPFGVRGDLAERPRRVFREDERRNAFGAGFERDGVSGIRQDAGEDGLGVPGAAASGRDAPANRLQHVRRPSELRPA